MHATLVLQRFLCRERLSSGKAETCLPWLSRSLALPCSRKGRVVVPGRHVSSKCSVKVRSCAVAAPERQILYRSELGYRTDFAEQYSLLEVIGKGNFGTVWLAVSRHEPLQEVAVKVIPKTREDRSHAESLDCIRREVALWGALSGDSRYVAELLGLYEDGNAVYLVQQLCLGGDLSELLQTGPLPEECCAAIMWCVLSAIRDCHDHHLALIDVKPQNFLLTASASADECPGGDCGVKRLRLENQATIGGSHQPCVVACDFGCSLSYAELMRGAKRAGSPVFFAPEQFTNSFSLVVDEWAAGVMLYLFLSGKYPFWDCKREDLDKTLPAYQVMLAVCGAPITFTCPEWSGVSREARDIVSQLLDRNPSTRLTAAKALEHPWFARWMRSSAGKDGPAAAPTTRPSSSHVVRRGGQDSDRLPPRRRKTQDRLEHGGGGTGGRQRWQYPSAAGAAPIAGCGCGGAVGAAAASAVGCTCDAATVGTATAAGSSATGVESNGGHLPCCGASNIVPLVSSPAAFPPVSTVPTTPPSPSSNPKRPCTSRARSMTDDAAGSGEDDDGCPVLHLL